MEKKVMGIILAVLGIIELILAGYNFMNGSGTRNMKEIILYGVLGAIFFFAGIGLMKTTRDRAT